MKLKWSRILAGILTGAVNFGTFFLAMAFALRHGLMGPSEWYDMPVVLALIFLPGLAWTGYLVRKAYLSRGDGRNILIKILHGITYLSSEPAGFAAAFFFLRGI